MFSTRKDYEGNCIVLNLMSTYIPSGLRANVKINEASITIAQINADIIPHNVKQSLSPIITIFIISASESCNSN